MAKTIKEIIIMLLVCLVTMLILAIALYKYIPTKKVVPEITTYSTPEEVQQLLSDNIDSQNNSTKNETVLTLKSGELNGYQKSNTYVPGKSNPFAAITNSTASDTEENTDSENNNTNNANNNNNQNTTENNGTNSNQSTLPSVYQGNGTK